MSKYRIVFQNGRRPRVIEADWYRRMGDWFHFFVRRSDGGGQTVARLPVETVAGIEEEVGDEKASSAAR